MKIAFVLLDAEVTGGQIVAEALLAGLRAAGHDAVAIFPSDGPMVGRVRSLGVEGIVLPLSRSYRLDEAILLGRLLRRERVDLLDTHTLYVGNQLARIAARLARIPLIVHSHIDERYHSSAPIGAAQRVVERIATPAGTTTVAVSSHLRKVLLGQGADPGRVVVIHNGVRLGDDTPPAGDGGLQLVCAARLAPVKGQEVLLEALRRAGPEISIAFIGADLERGGAYRVRLERLAVELGVGARAQFVGARDDVPQLLQAAGGLVLPSFAEGFPLVVLEAMAQARPVIATEVGGTPEAVVDGETGILVPAGDAGALAAALDRLSRRPELGRSYGLAGRARVARLFTTDQMISRTLSLYESVLSATDAPGRAGRSARRPGSGRS